MYKTSLVHEALASGEMPIWAHVVLDDAFGCTEQELVAWSAGKKRISAEKDAFNYYLSAQRQSVERVFGVMYVRVIVPHDSICNDSWIRYQRWGILWRSMSFGFDRYKLILVALCRLHNFINMDLTIAKLHGRVNICHEDDTMWRRGLDRNGDMPAVAEMVMVSDAAAPNRRQGAGARSDLYSDKRVVITRAMRDNKILRPVGSKEAQALRLLRENVTYTCLPMAPGYEDE